MKVAKRNLFPNVCLALFPAQKQQKPGHKKQVFLFAYSLGGLEREKAARLELLIMI